MPQEDQHHLDIVIGQKRPYLQQISNILSLYRAALIYSNGQYKIISDRADLPIRMVFHSGNMVPGQTEIKMGGEPNKPNQVNVQFANAEMRYIQDIKYVQDSESIQGQGQPIRPQEMDLTGIVRPTEAVRQASVFLQRLNLIKREISWETGLEALAVEPGDICVVGINLTDYEAGYGGRVLDGTSRHFVADREIEIKSGYTYGLYLWHTQTDTVEQKTVANPTGFTITVSPTTGFVERALPGDRWAIGISSEDLTTVRVVSVARRNDGGHKITGEEFVAINYKLDCTQAATAVTSNSAPAQPTSATVTQSNCNLCFSILTAPNCQGGILTRPGSTVSVYVTGSGHNPTSMSLYGDAIVFPSGAASGSERTVTIWDPTSKFIKFSPAVTAAPASGDPYYIRYRQPTFGGVMVQIGTSGAPVSSFTTFDSIAGAPGAATQFSGCIDVTRSLPSERIDVRLVPFSSRGLQNSIGVWTFSLYAPGCADIEQTTNVVTITGSSEQLLYAVTWPGHLLGLRNKTFGDINIRATEVCSPASESTELALHFDYGSQRLVNSLVILWNEANSNTVIGSNQPGVVKFSLEGLGTTSSQLATLQYLGPANSGFTILGATGTGSVNHTIAQTIAIKASFRHFDGGVHSHGCYFLVAIGAAQGFTDVDSGDEGFGNIDPPPSPFDGGTQGNIVNVSSGANKALIPHGLGNVNAPISFVPNWNTTVYVSSATANAVYVNFGTIAPGSVQAQVRWIGT